MNLAFPFLILFVLTLPGITLRYTYARGPWRWASPTSLNSLTDEIAYGLGFAVVLHGLWIALAEWFGAEVDLGSALLLLSGAYEPESPTFQAGLASIHEHVSAVLVYLVTLYGFAALIGYGAHMLVRHLGLDLKTRALRFNNEWYYLLTGEVLKFKEMPFDYEEIDGVYLSAVVDYGGLSYLYRGVVADFSFDRRGELDKIFLRLAHRRKMTDDRKGETSPKQGMKPDPSDERYYDIRGDLFMLRYSEATTLNLDYFELEDPGLGHPASKGGFA